jgi:predicted dinucleotide-binding enzyme
MFRTSSITIIGLGSMAGTLAARALAGGNTVELIGRDPAKTEALAATLDGATAGTPGAAPAGDIVLLAVPYGSTAAVVHELGDALRGKVLVDVTNPVSPDLKGLVTPDDSSGAQEIAKVVPDGVHVVKAFNTLFANVLAATPDDGRPLDAFIAGDDTEAKARVSALAESMGLRPLDTGELPMARALEYTGLLMVGLITGSVGNASFSLGVTELGQ